LPGTAKKKRVKLPRTPIASIPNAREGICAETTRKRKNPRGEKEQRRGRGPLGMKKRATGGPMQMRERKKGQRIFPRLWRGRKN